MPCTKKPLNTDPYCSALNAAPMCLPCSRRQNTVVLRKCYGDHMTCLGAVATRQRILFRAVRVYAGDDHLVDLAFAKVAFQVGTATKARIPM